MKGKLTLLLLLLSTWSVAQEGTGPYTLEECIAYALANNVDAKNALLDEQIAEARVKETVGIGLPQVTGTVGLQQSPTQPRFFTQYLEGQSFFISDEQADQLGLENEDVVALENIFQLKGAGDARLSINQLIFNGSYIVGLQASKAYKDLSVKQGVQTDEQVIMNVSKAYYNLLIAREQLELVDANLLRLDTLYRNTRAMYENGFAEKIDADRLKVTLNNLKVSKQNMESMNDISLRLLKFQMNFPPDQELEVEGTLEDAALQAVAVPEEWDYSRRPDYQVLQSNYELQKLNIKNKYAESLPTISGFANLGYSTQSPNFGGLFSTNTDIEDQGGLGPDQWYSYSTVGLSLQWNLFTGLQRTYQIQQEKLSLSKIENGFEALERSIMLDVKRSKDNLDNALSQLEVQRENAELAEEIFEITQIKFQEGVGSNLEVIEADTSLKEAQTNYYRALYDAIIAQLELKKALGILHNEQ
ncbi:TolC family protein [Marinoscillum furvescens]|uniref:Outer membrane protein TolC n=1 Tax=Marinoscillum furvescens DSM 4134 TaxID=1122208 RepID=A0A3D9L753_MARFU|nr:TolC family protein [Marinoscillum furvescens]REE02191.1 outer membrane protein TolC [Marinoscillum furvescens DSM 4134]